MDDILKRVSRGCLKLLTKAAKLAAIMIGILLILAVAAILLAVAAVIVGAGAIVMLAAVLALFVGSVLAHFGGSMIEYFRSLWKTATESIKEAVKKRQPQEKRELNLGQAESVLETVRIDDDIV